MLLFYRNYYKISLLEDEIMKTGRRRGFKSWFVEPYKQVRLGLMFLLVNIVFSILILGVFGYYVIDIYRAVTMYFQLNAQESLMTLEKFALPLVVGVFIIFAFVITTILVSVKYTHGIYGPLVSIHRFLDDLLEAKKPTPLHLRESDQLRDLADKLNKLSECMMSDPRSGAMQAIHRYLDQLIAGQDPGILQLREADTLQELSNKINQLNRLVHKK